MRQHDFQGSSVINYPELKYKFTRIHEPKHLHPERDNNYKKSVNSAVMFLKGETKSLFLQMEKDIKNSEIDA